MIDFSALIDLFGKPLSDFVGLDLLSFEYNFLPYVYVHLNYVFYLGHSVESTFQEQLKVS